MRAVRERSDGLLVWNFSLGFCECEEERGFESLSRFKERTGGKFIDRVPLNNVLFEF